MFISKHHYAVELAKAGNTVYYMEGPLWPQGNIGKTVVKLEPTEFDNLHVIRHWLPYPAFIKHKFEWLHLLLIKKHIDKVLKHIGRKVDVVWSFDISNTLPLSAFPADMVKIFMPVDEPKKRNYIEGAKTAQAIFSVTQEILDMYKPSGVPEKFLNHGVADAFIVQEISDKVNTPVNVGLSGNFLRPDLDWDTILAVISNHPDVVFNFYGTTSTDGANLTAVKHLNLDPALEQLKIMPNVQLHGLVNKERLTIELKRMDAFFICYDIDKDASSGTNYHKVLEYLATGKVIVSNNITTYANTPELLSMPQERNNGKLVALFGDVIKNLDKYNSYERQKARIDFAKHHTYTSNIKKIESFVTEYIH